ncbi:collagen-like protein [Pseudoalteromonas sp. SWN29]|uniref:collagen-like protein n=1 Tax=Pseudoalteromonas sp. SWN29 TaxID=2792064 RepID=UPI0018CFA7E7|nr:collagen-like protein [Pseudoalteromonas sp. SWN29]MBH0025907.1 collagen-like protein [Pseudoalteromonas sp. SWN29]MBH0025915.1 collagen-like protein [Pseudoalteromonas sp. SWN29]
MLKLSALTWSGLKYILLNPIKFTFALLKLWVCLMFFSLFATLVMAQDYNPNDLKPPAFKDTGQCYSGYSGYSTGTDYDLESCKSYVQSSISDPLLSFSHFEGNNIYFKEYNEIYRVYNYYGSGKLIPTDTILGCPPDDFPKYVIPVGEGENVQCAKPYEPNECPDATESDQYVFGTAVSPSNVCYDNPDSESQCNISTDDTGGYYLPSQYGSQEPVNCNTPPDSTGENGEDDEDKFCYVSGSNGIFQADCPTTAMTIDITGIQKNADQLLVNHERFQAIESSIITQEHLDQLKQSGELKGEKGDKGQKGDVGASGADGRNGVNGSIGASGSDGSDGSDGKDGKDGIDGKDGADGIAGADGNDGEDGEDGTDGIDGKNGLDGNDGEDGEDGENCTVVNTSKGAAISCPDGSNSEVEGVDVDAVVSELKTQTSEIKKQTDLIKDFTEIDGDIPTVDYSSKPDKFLEIENFDWEATNFGTVLEEHNEAMSSNPIFHAVDNFFVTSFSGTCPVYTTTVNLLGSSLTITIDQFCSTAVQSILPYIRAILMLVAGFFAWRIAIE